MFYKTCFVITMTPWWCNLFANICENVVTYDMLCWITVILVVCKLVWNPSRFRLTTGFIWAQVREFDHFDDCFCTCALINWSVPWQSWRVAVVWRILLVGTDRSLYLIVRCLFQFRCLNLAPWTWFCNNVFMRTLIVWNGLSTINSFSLLDPGWKHGLFEFSLGVCSTEPSNVPNFRGT